VEREGGIIIIISLKKEHNLTHGESSLSLSVIIEKVTTTYQFTFLYIYYIDREDGLYNDTHYMYKVECVGMMMKSVLCILDLSSTSASP